MLAGGLWLAPALAGRVDHADAPYPAVSDPSSLEDGERIYRSACAACHGADGTGAPQSRLGFDVQPPDFTDCGFATREATADWVAVAHQGGPVRAFSRFMPAFGEALTAAQLEAAIGHIRSFCKNDAWPRGEFNLPRPLFTTKAFPEDEVVVNAVADKEDPGSFELEAVFEKRIGARNQLEAAVPFGWRETADAEGEGSGDWRSVLGDLVLGYKRVVYDDLDTGAIVSANAELVMPTGDEESGFSSGTVLFEPSLLYGQLLGGGYFLQGQVGTGLPLEGDEANDEAFWRLVGGRAINQGRWGRRWTPMVELLGAREFAEGVKSHWDVAPQLQVTLSRRQHVRLGMGARIPLDERDERETRLAVYLLWDWFDGGLFEGW